MRRPDPAWSRGSTLADREVVDVCIVARSARLSILPVGSHTIRAASTRRLVDVRILPGIQRYGSQALEVGVAFLIGNHQHLERVRVPATMVHGVVVQCGAEG